MFLTALLAAAVAAVAVSGALDGQPGPTAPDDGASATAPAPRADAAARRRPARGRARRRPSRVRRGTAVRVIRSRYGRVLADGRGRPFYLFDRERTRRPRCYGGCAAAWPPVLARGKPFAGRGARSRLVGTVRRRDGRRQVTYRGRPMYYYVHDRPHVILCQDVVEFGGRWLVVQPSGAPVG